MLHRSLPLAGLILLLPLFCLAQVFDSQFSPLITRVGDIQKIRVLPNGSFYAAGDFTLANRTEESSVARFLTDGSLDESFQATLPFSTTALAVQPDGKVIIGGFFTGASAPEGLTILRLNTDGSQDLTFQAGFIPQGNINDIEVEFNGTILVAGSFTLYDGMAAQGLVRLNDNGSLQQIISLDPNRTIFANDLITQVNGRFAVAGVAVGGPNGPEGYLSYRTYNGVPVGNFSYSSDLPGVNNFMTSVRDITFDNLGRIVLTASTFLIRYAVVVLNVDGSINNWSDIFGIPMDVALDPQGSVLVAGEFNGVNAVHRYLPNEGLDFYDAGPGADGVIREMVVADDGRILLGGNFSRFNGAAALGLERLSPTGLPIPSFNPAVERPGRVLSIARYDDSRVCIGGDFTMIGNTFSPNIARLMLSDGTYDPSFSQPGISYRNIIRTITVDPQGRIYLGGTNNNTGSNIAQSPVLRLMPDGQIDGSFAPSPLPLGEINSLVPLGNGQVLAVGNFNVFNPGIIAQSATVYEANGAINTAFSDRFSGQARAALQQADGNILLAGPGMSLDGAPAAPMLRLTPSLQIDGSFSAPAGFTCLEGCEVHMAELPNGQLMIGGAFAVGADSLLVRLQPGGQLDASFQLDGPLSPESDEEDAIAAPSAIALMANDQILVAAPADSIGATPINRLVLIGNDGQVSMPLNGDAFETQLPETVLPLSSNTALIGGTLIDPARPGHFALARIAIPIMANADISGEVLDINGEPVIGAQVSLQGGATATTQTDENGAFSFEGLNAGLSYTLSAALDTMPLNGVSTLDLILINQHILGLNLFGGPLPYLAADINNTSSITILDMIGIRKAILGISTTVGDNPSWKFVPQAFTFSSPSNPWATDIPSTISINALPLEGVADADFVGIKMGDVNGDADTGN